MDEPRRFALSYGSSRRLMTLLGTGPEQTWVEVAGDTIEVRMGWAFRARFPVSAIAEASAWTGPVRSVGAHGWRGTWLVNGSSRGVVQLVLEPPQRALVMGFPVRLDRLRISLEAPAEMLQLVSGN